MAVESWRLIRSGPLTGAQNMAVDEALFEAVAEGRSGPVLRLYRWSPPAVTLGYFQGGAEAVNLEACRRMGIEVVRRYTGGRAVLHDREVTYSVISTERGPVFPGGILENYRVIAFALQHALEALGVPATFAPGRRRREGEGGVHKSACFTAPSSYELVFNGCKMTGSAQKRGGSSFLQHGSIPVDLDLAKLFRALDTGPSGSAEEAVPKLARKIGWLNRWLDSPVGLEEVEEVLVDSFCRRLEIELFEDRLSAAEEDRVGSLMKSKYGNSDWNLKGIL